MKKILFSILLLLSSAVLFGQKKGPFSYPYYIKGVTEIDPNNGEITLNNIEVKGFTYSDFKKAGINLRSEKASFIFERIRTNPAISLTGKTLQYWRQDRSGEWITDAEGGSGTFNDKLEKNITIVMALDCSSSMGSDFSRLQSGAISFLNRIYTTSQDGHIRLGIIGFSSIKESDRQVFEIKPLTNNTFDQAKRFINSLQKESNTALYYAMNKATDMLQEYVAQKFYSPSETEYGGTYMLVFTDGLDNASQFRDKKIFRSDDAYSYVADKLQNTYIKRESIETYIIGARGSDLTTNSQRDEFKQRLEGLIPKQNKNGEFIYLENMNNLEDTFKRIAESLTEQWQNLVCMTTLAHEGGVCWTLGNIPVIVNEPVVVRKPVRNCFLGVTIGAGWINYDDSFYGGNEYADGNVFFQSSNLDFAWPISQKISLGGFLGFQPVLEHPWYDFSLSSGVLAVFGNYHERKKAFILGIGGRFSDDFGPYVRLGMMFKNGLYFTGDLSYNDDERYMSLNIGYNFGRFIKIRK